MADDDPGVWSGVVFAQAAVSRTFTGPPEGRPVRSEDDLAGFEHDLLMHGEVFVQGQRFVDVTAKDDPARARLGVETYRAHHQQESENEGG